MALDRWVNPPRVGYSEESLETYGFGIGMIALTATVDLLQRQVLDKKHTPKRSLPSRLFELALFGGISYLSTRALRSGLRVKLDG